jgi:putative membrane protein insertion efficiency factor
MKTIATFLIKAYQSYSATRAPRCKYYPSCSNYTATAIQRYGFKGLAMSLWRLVRCNPWSHGGVDYVDEDLDSADALNIARITQQITQQTTQVSSTADMEGVH